MKVLIHTYPRRLWYVEGFLIPELERQGADEIEVWNDTEKKGNLRACMESFASRTGDGGTWHIQDDVLLCRRFVERCRELDDGVVYGFCCPQFTDDVRQTGRVNVEDAWHSFQCVRIPDAYARECAEWLEKDAYVHELYPLWMSSGCMDDSVFREFMRDRHPRDWVTNTKPNLVDHVDWIVGGSILSPYREYLARAEYFEDRDLVDELRKAVKGKVQYFD